MHWIQYPLGSFILEIRTGNVFQVGYPVDTPTENSCAFGKVIVILSFYTISNDFPSPPLHADAQRGEKSQCVLWRTCRRWSVLGLCLLVHLCSFAVSWSTTSRKGLYHLLLTGIILGVFLSISIVCRNRRGKENEVDQGKGWWGWYCGVRAGDGQC